MIGEMQPIMALVFRPFEKIIMLSQYTLPSNEKPLNLMSDYC